MQICGFQKITLLDYPEHLACVIFLGGCNFRCPFCQNGSLVLSPDTQPNIPKGEIIAYLKKRRGILEGICISGGEPTLAPDLLFFMEEIKELDYNIKLDTNGYNPKVIEAAAQKGLLDYIAMDIKASPDTYPVLCGKPDIAIERIKESVSIIQTLGIAHEFRTTVVKPYHNSNTFEAIGQWLQGGSPYYLQQYQDSPDVVQSGLSAFSPEEMLHFKEILLPMMPNTHLRGLEEFE